MPEVRQDLLLKHRVIFAPERAARPFEHRSSADLQPLSRCPFCAGHEELTSPAVLEVAAIETVGRGEWGVRVVPNLYPALSRSQDTTSVQRHVMAEAGVGQHEVIIEAPHHATTMASLSECQFRIVAESYRQRMKVVRQAGQARHVSVFKNEGAAAGASLEHVHSQLIATPFVADAVARMSTAAGAYFAESRTCFFCDLMRSELKQSERIVLVTDDFVCWCPFASRFASEICLMPRRHRSCFDELDDAELAAFASALRECLVKLQRVMPQVEFNFVIHTAPFEEAAAGHFHWHVEIMPRVMGLAGFEVGAGCHINITLPEVAAAALRGAR